MSRLNKSAIQSKSDYLLAASYVINLVFISVLDLQSPINNILSFGDGIFVSLSILAITILPGYLFLSTIYWKVIDIDLKLVISFFISIIFGSIIGLLSLDKLSFYFIPVILFLISKIWFKLRNGKSYHKKLEISRKHILSLALIAGIALICYFIYFQNFGLRGDLWRVFADSVFINNHGLSNYATYYPYFLLSFYSSLYSVTGFSALTVFLLVVSESIIFLTLSFKLAVEKITNSLNIALISSLIWVLFSGFDWIFTVPGLLKGSQAALIFYEAGTKHMGGIIYQPWTYGFDHTLSVVGLGASFVVIALILEKKYAGFFRYLLIALIGFVAYACYVQEAILLIYGFFVIFSLRELNHRILLLESLSLLSGLFFVVVYSTFSGAMIEYYWSFTYLPTHILFLFSYTLFLAMYKYKRPMTMNLSRIRIFINNHKQRIMFFIVISISILYIFSLFIEFLFINYLPKWPFWTYSPLYHYPVSFGVAGFLVLFVIFAHPFRLHKLRSFEITALLILIWSIIMAELFGWFKLGRPGGMISWIFAFVSIICAVFFFKLLKARRLRSSRQGKIILAIIILIILSFGSLSSFMGFYFWNEHPGPYFDPGLEIVLDKNDNALINYLHQKAASDIFSVACDNWRTNEIIKLAGVRTLSADLDNLFITASDPETVYQLQNDQSIRYLVTESNTALNKFGFSKNFLSNNAHLTSIGKYNLIELENTQPSSAVADIGLIYSKNVQSYNAYFSTNLLATSNYSYTSFQENDSSQLNSNMIFLLNDIGRVGWEASLESGYQVSEGSVKNRSEGLLFTPSNTLTNHDLSFSIDCNFTVHDFPYISIAGDAFNNIVWLCIHSVNSNWHFIALDKLTSEQTYNVNLFDFESHGNGFDYSPEPIKHDSLKAEEKIDQVAFRVYDTQSIFSIQSVKILSNPIGASIDYLPWISKGGSLIVFSDDKEGLFNGIARSSLPNYDYKGVRKAVYGNGSIIILSSELIGNELSSLTLTELDSIRQVIFSNRSSSLEKPSLYPILWGAPEKPGHMSFSNATFSGNLTFISRGDYLFSDPNVQSIKEANIEKIKTTELTFDDTLGNNGVYSRLKLGPESKIIYHNAEVPLPEGTIIEVKKPIISIEGNAYIEKCQSFSIGNIETPYLRGVNANITGNLEFEIVNQDSNYYNTKVSLFSGRIYSATNTIYTGYSPSDLYLSLPWFSVTMITVIVSSTIIAVGLFYFLAVTLKKQRERTYL